MKAPILPRLAARRSSRSSPPAAAARRTSRAAAAARRRAQLRGGGGSEANALARRLLDPAGRLRRDHPGFQKTAAGKGVGFKTSFGASGDQSRAVEAGLHADVVSFSTEPDMTGSSRPASSPPTGTPAPNKGLVTTSLVALHRPQGQPEEHQDLGRPAQAGHPGPHARTRSPRARRSGTCSPPTARPPTAARTRRRGSTTCASCIKDHVKVQDKSGREALQTFTGGQGDVLLSYEYEATTAQKKGEKVDYVIAGRHDQDQHRLAHDQGRAAGGPGLPRLRAVASRRRRSSPSWGYRPVEPGGPGREQGQVPDPARPVHDRGPRRLVEGQRRAVRPREGLDRQDRGGRGSVDRQVSTPPLPQLAAARAGPALRARAPRVAASASSTLWLSLIVLLPLAAVVARVVRRRPRRVLGRRDQPPGGRRAEVHAAACRSLVAVDQRGDRDADRLGARPRPASRASGSSTR